MAETLPPNAPEHSKSGLLWTAVKVLLAVSLVVLVATKIDVAELFAAWQQVSMPWAAGTATFFWASLVVVAVRYSRLLENKVPLRSMLDLVVIQTVTTNLVASSAGVASYLGILLVRHGINLGQAGIAFLLARLCDLLVLLVAIALVLAPIWGRITVLQWPVLILLVSLGSVLTSVFIILLLRQRFVTLIKKICERLNLLRIRRIGSLLARVELLAYSDSQWLTRISIPLIIQTTLYTILQFGYLYCSFRMFGVNIGPADMAFVMCINLIIAAVPIQIFGGLGVVELTSLYLYALLGYSEAHLAPAILGGRVVFYLINLATLIYLPLSGVRREPLGAVVQGSEPQDTTAS
jgi:uncharacterized membrane protein YbhN (UPF0104 family)